MLKQGAVAFSVDNTVGDVCNSFPRCVLQYGPQKEASIYGGELRRFVSILAVRFRDAQLFIHCHNNIICLSVNFGVIFVIEERPVSEIAIDGSLGWVRERQSRRTVVVPQRGSIRLTIKTSEKAV